MTTNDRLSDNQFGEAHIDMLKSLQENVNWNVEAERNSLFHDILALIRLWSGPFPDFGEIFCTRQMDWLLIKATRIADLKLGRRFINFVISSGYKVKPILGKDGKPSSRRITVVHREAQRMYIQVCTGLRNIVPDLFKIYDIFDVNYSDKEGYTHLHAACEAGANDALKKFLEHGHDPNLSYSPPLHLAMTRGHKQVIETLLRAGADPNSVDGNAETPLHVACSHWRSRRDTAKFFLDICEEIGAPVNIGALNSSGWPVLHRALNVGNWDMAELLLRRGADPNSSDRTGRTPLHIICGKDYRDRSMEPFFRICDKLKQTVLVNVLSQNGLRPLQMAVTNLRPDQVDLLLDHGAYLKKLVFPTYEDLVKQHLPTDRTAPDKLLRLVAGTMGVVECLEKHKYVLRPEDVFVITKFVTRVRAFAKKTDVGFDDENFVREAKKLKIRPDLSLHDLIRLRVEEAAERLTYKDYYEFACSEKSLEQLPEGSRDTCARHLCEKVSRGFFRRAATNALSRNGAGNDGIEESMNADLCKIFVENTLRAVINSMNQ